MRQGKCTNFGNCGVADRREIVTAGAGQELVCPECRRALSESDESSRAPSPLWVVGFLLLLLVVGYTGWRLLHRSSPAPDPAPMVGSSAPPAGPKPSSTDVVLRLHGSNTIGAN